MKFEKFEANLAKKIIQRKDFAKNYYGFYQRNWFCSLEKRIESLVSKSLIFKELLKDLAKLSLFLGLLICIFYFGTDSLGAHSELQQYLMLSFVIIFLRCAWLLLIPSNRKNVLMYKAFFANRFELSSKILVLLSQERDFIDERIVFLKDESSNIKALTEKETDESLKASLRVMNDYYEFRSNAYHQNKELIRREINFIEEITYEEYVRPYRLA